MIEVLKQALEVIETAIKAGDWKVDGACDPDNVIHGLRQAIRERALYEVQRLGQEIEQEPVAWMSPNKERLEFSRKDTVYGSHTIPLYTHPPQRTWQGLTDKEREEATGWSVEHIEAKLKEKNND